MLEINTDDNSSSLISLSHAARLSGYHQDYLGQLCRTGKLPASKVGRNWFTSKEAVEKLGSQILESELGNDFVDDELYSDSLAESTEEAESSTIQPTLIQTITVSQVDGLPVAIQTVENPPRMSSNLREILTNMRIQSLQSEVRELREMLSMLMTEVASHARMLQDKGSSAANDGLRHSYISSSDFGLSTPQKVSREQFAFQFTEPRITSADNSEEQQKEVLTKVRPEYSFSTIIAATGALVLLVYLIVGITTGSFMGHENTQVSTIYHHHNNNPVLDGPTVAGETTLVPSVLPTGATGDTSQNMVK